MAEIHLNSGERLQAYEALFLLNRSFRSIVRRLQELDATRIFNPRHLRDLRGLTQELQSEVNHHLLDTLHAAEEEDWYRFGKVRIARDRRFKEPA